jgi:uncharacterized membrane protein YhiD involved in acid resistance
MTAPRRRWSFGLRTLFIVVTALTIALVVASRLGATQWAYDVLYVIACRITGVKC